MLCRGKEAGIRVGNCRGYHVARAPRRNPISSHTYKELSSEKSKNQAPQRWEPANSLLVNSLTKEE